MQPSITEIKRLDEYAPDHWFGDRAKSSVWIAAFRAFRVQGDFENRAKVLDIKEARIIFFQGRLKYLDANVELDMENDRVIFKIGNPTQKSSSWGDHVVIIAPFNIDGIPGDENAARDLVLDSIGLLSIFFGRNVVFKKLFEHSFECSTGRPNIQSETFENPLAFKKVDLDHKNLENLSLMNSAIHKLPKPEKNRVCLALRWFQSAIHEVDGTDSFLKYWISIEILIMEKKSDIGPVKRAIEKIYEISSQEAGEKFRIWGLYDLRCSIVHNGDIGPISAGLLRYTEALFADILAHKIGFKSDFRARCVLEDPEFNLAEALDRKEKSFRKA